MTNKELIDMIISMVENRAKINDVLESRNGDKDFNPYYMGVGDALSLVLIDLNRVKENLK